MASFGRTARQDVIWVLFNDIRVIVDEGLLDPDEGEYEDDGSLQAEWDALETEYDAIHAANDTKG